MIHELKKPAMQRVTQPAPALREAYWTKVEVDLLAAMASAAIDRQAARKMVQS